MTQGTFRFSAPDPWQAFYLHVAEQPWPREVDHEPKPVLTCEGKPDRFQHYFPKLAREYAVLKQHENVGELTCD